MCVVGKNGLLAGQKLIAAIDDGRAGEYGPNL